MGRGTDTCRRDCADGTEIVSGGAALIGEYGPGHFTLKRRTRHVKHRHQTGRSIDSLLRGYQIPII